MDECNGSGGTLAPSAEQHLNAPAPTLAPNPAPTSAPSPAPSSMPANITPISKSSVVESMIQSPTLFILFVVGSAAGALVAFVTLQRRQVHNGEANIQRSPATFEDIAACAGLALVSILIAKSVVVSKVNFRVAMIWCLDMTEAAMYAAIYVVAASWVGTLPDAMLPAYDSTVMWPRLLAEVGLQAGLNVVLAQVIRDSVKQLPLPDLGSPGDRTGTATGGGIILAMILFSRQPAWKAKVALLDKLLGLHIVYGIPKPILELFLW